MALQSKSHVTNKQRFRNADGQADVKDFLKDFTYSEKCSVSVELACRWESGGSWEIWECFLERYVM